jgi:erythromycin esterase
MQYARVAMNDVDEYLGTVDAAAQAAERAQYACYRIYQDSVATRHPSYATEGGGECQPGVDSVYMLLATNRARFTGIGGSTRYEYALRAARVVQQKERYECCKLNEVARASAMAENASWLLDQAGPGAKIILWAHNAHINDLNYEMGSFLRERYGADYVPLGFATDSGTYNSYDASNAVVLPTLRPVPITPLDSDSYEWQFANLGMPIFLADLRSAKALPASDPGAWIKGPLKFGMYTEQWVGPRGVYAVNTPLAARFDLLIFIRRTGPSTLLPFVYY